MGLHLILGRAGSGKTHWCLEQITKQLREDPLGPPLILLVPEQATFQMEQALLTRIQAVSRARVLSFRRLANMILLDTGGNLRPNISEIGKRMLVRSILMERQNSLKLLGLNRIHGGLVEKLLAAFKEFRNHCYSPQDIYSMTENCPSIILRDKLEDMALVYGAYDRQLQRVYADSDLVLNKATEKIREFAMLQGAELWLDGFADFSLQEYSMIEQMLLTVKSFNVALCMDKPDNSDSGSSSIFYHTGQTYRKLKSLAEKLSVETTEQLIPGGKRFFQSPALYHLEKEWDKSQTPACTFDQNHIHLYKVPDRVKEIEHVAKEILRLSRDEGYRFKDISVITRNLEPYLTVIPRVFRSKGIPFFLDQVKSVSHHPLIGLMVSGLEILATNWNTESVLSYLKTDLAPVTREEADLLEEYVLEHGVTGRAWTKEKPWGYSVKLLQDDEGLTEEDDLYADIDRIRRKAVQPLSDLEKALSVSSLTPKVAADSLINFLDQLKVREVLFDWITTEQAEGEGEAASVHSQIWDKVMEVILQLKSCFAGCEITIEQLYQMVVEATDGITVGVIPPKLDQVLIGAIDRSRQPNKKAAFIVGAVDGEFPLVKVEDALLTDGEKEALKDLGYDLGESREELVKREEFLVYIALTRASHYLWVSYPLSDDRGKALIVSNVYRRLGKMFPGGESVYKDLEHVTIENLATVKEIPAVAAGRLRQNPADLYWSYVKSRLLKETKVADWASFIFSSLEYSNHLSMLPLQVARPLYGLSSDHPLHTSVSRLETFAQCPFKHFAAYGLALKEREPFKLDPSRMGMLNHAVLKAFVDYVKKKENEIDNLDSSSYIDYVLAKIAEQMAGEIIISSDRQKYLVEAMGRGLKTAARLILEHWEKSSFKPFGTEVRFNGAFDEYPGLSIELPDGSVIYYVGIIDRIDQAVIDGEKYIRIIDYKSSVQKLDLSEVYYGISLQLLLYLAIAKEMTRSKPAGALYAPVFYPIVLDQSGLDPQKIWSEQKKVLRYRGLLVKDINIIRHMHHDLEGTSDLIPVRLNKDQNFGTNSQVIPEELFNHLLTMVQHIAKEIAVQIFTGEHRINPIRKADNSRACEYCPYHPVCCFDVLVEGNQYRYLTKLTDSEVLEEARSLSNKLSFNEH